MFVEIDVAVPGLWLLLGSSFEGCSELEKEGKAVAMKAFVAECGSRVRIKLPGGYICFISLAILAASATFCCRLHSSKLSASEGNSYTDCRGPASSTKEGKAVAMKALVAECGS